MAITDVVDEYFTYENRLASFQNAQQLSKRRASNASTKAPKLMKWPHKWLLAEDLAKAGFFYYPILINPDNVACFLCHKNIDGWEEGDDPLVEHLKHSPNCGWAIVATIETQDGELSEEYPCSARMIEARKATFADRWPHEGKRGWKCKVKQMVDAGWKYTPSQEYDDMATCTYCNLALDGWENEDKPLDEHFNRSADCPFFTLVNNNKQSPAPKRTKSKKGRASKISRLSTQSAFTVASDSASFTDLPTEEGDSILTTATNSTVTTQGGRKMTKGKKSGNSKAGKAKAKKNEAVEVKPAPEPEDDDFEVKVEVDVKPPQGRKRKTDDTVDLAASVIECHPPPKRRVTRTRASTVVDESITINADDTNQSIAVEDAPKPKGRKKGRSSVARSTRKDSAASVVSRDVSIPNDDEIDAALEADLERRLTDDEGPLLPPKKATRSSKIVKADQAMFGTEPMEVDEAAIELELQALEAESKTLPKARGAKGKQPRKVSAKQQAAARKVVEAGAESDAEAQKVAEAEASQQIVAELEHSLSIHQSSPVTQPKKQRASSRQPARQLPGRRTRGSVLPVNESTAEVTDVFHDAVDDQKYESGNETDASMASQSTVVRGGSTRRASTMKKGRAGKKLVTSNIEEIVRRPKEVVSEYQELPIVAVPEPASIHVDDSTAQEEAFYTPAPEALPVVEVPIAKVSKPRAAPKGRGRPPKTGVPARVQEVRFEAEPESEAQPEAAREEAPTSTTAKGKLPAPRSPTPPLKESTPADSPQSSDAENHPPSSKPSASARKPATPQATSARIPLAATPIMSPSKRNVIAGLQSAHPWSAVDLDVILLKSPGDENVAAIGMIGEAMLKAKNGDLTSPEKRMTVEEWIQHNAEAAEEKLRSECERMVGVFEREGGRAMQALEGVECLE
ncbi:Chromosome segregation cut17 [Hyphodiscus hymeniophilus]|uniref:Chromosome segregation cut17 n=1 Tax=Hyphodiscus hymeniophilus TaxID=353542 RepID=A0A9P6VJJ0_9HELO|nr:Chromosome segregation cut17 [Hyphodiscus hymeniophilus]